MTKKNIYEAIIAVIEDPDLFTSWLNLEKTYRVLNLIQEAEIIKNYRHSRFKEKKENDNSSNFSNK